MSNPITVAVNQTLYRLKQQTTEDIINMGFRHTVTGTGASGLTESVILNGSVGRLLVLYGFIITSDNSTGMRVTLSFAKAGSTSVKVADVFVSLGAPVVSNFAFGDFRSAEEQWNLVITTSGTGNCFYTCNLRIVGVVPVAGQQLA